MYTTKYNFLTLVITVLFAALLAGRGVFIFQRNQADKTETSLRGQIADLNNQLASANHANWKTFTDSATGLSFQYPSDLTLTSSPDQPRTGRVLMVRIQPMDSIGTAMGWYGGDVALSERTALLKGDLTETRGADQLLKLSGGAVGASMMVLQNFTCANVMFLWEAHMYRGNYQIMIGLQDYDIDPIKANNSRYFALNKTCSGENSTVQSWANQEAFAADLKAGTTDARSQKWYSTFQQILSTVSFR